MNKSFPLEHKKELYIDDYSKRQWNKERTHSIVYDLYRLSHLNIFIDYTELDKLLIFSSLF